MGGGQFFLSLNEQFSETDKYKRERYQCDTHELHAFHVLTYLQPHCMVPALSVLSLFMALFSVTLSLLAQYLQTSDGLYLAMIMIFITAALCLFQLVLPEYLIHVFFCVMFLCAAEWLTLALNMPLLAYHVYRWVGLSHFLAPITLLLLGPL